jgi:Carboxypeptidase regulatory-like domain
MRKYRVIALVLLLAALSATTLAKDKEKTQAGRLVTGKVVDRQDNPLTGAVVYISDSRSHAVKTYITGADGAFHFPALSLNNDYELYAQHQSRKSDTKNVGQFDNRAQVSIILKIDTR